MTRVSVKIYKLRYEVIQTVYYPNEGLVPTVVYKSGNFRSAQNLWDNLQGKCKANEWQIFGIGHM